MSRRPRASPAAVDTLLADCAGDAECNRAYPDLEESLLAAARGGGRGALSVTVNNPAEGLPLRLQVTDTDLVEALFGAFSDADVVRVLPYVIDRLAAGDVEAAIPLAQRNVDDADGATEGLQLSIDCAEEAPFNDDERIAAALSDDELLAHYGLSDGFREDCELWAVPRRRPRPRTSPSPARFPRCSCRAGTTPSLPAHSAESTAETLAVHYMFTFPGQGHGVGVDEPGR